MNYAKVLIFLALVAVFWTEFYLQTDIDIFIEEPSGKPSVVRMSRRDAKRLDYFFRELMISEPLAFTLTGAKPISFAGYRQPGSSLSSLSLPNLKIIRGWKIWEKHQHRLSTARIKFWKEDSPWTKGVSCLIMADVEQCTQRIDQDFATECGLQQPSDLFKNVGKIPFFRDTLHRHDALIGILLGFGKNNAWLYYENNKDQKPVVKLPRIWGAITEQESSEYYWKYCTLQTLDMANLLLPNFVGDPDSVESKELKRKYLAEREKIRRFYKGKDFLSATLSLYKHGSKVL